MCIHGEIFIVAVKVCSHSMIVVEHGGYTIKTETIKMVFCHPELQVGQKKVNDFCFTIVETLGAPGWMITLISVMEELPCGSIEHVDALGGVLHCVRVHHIQ